LFSEKSRGYIRLELIEISKIFVRIIRLGIFFINIYINRLIKSPAERLLLNFFSRHPPYQYDKMDEFKHGKRKKPHFLILCDHFNYGNSLMGESIGFLAVNNTLIASNLASFDTFYWDIDYSGFPRGDLAVFDKCRAVRPDAIILSSYDPHNKSQPSVETIRILHDDWNIPIIAIWWDTCWIGFWKYVQSILAYVDINIIPENPLLTFLDGKSDEVNRDRFLPLWGTWDPLIYNNPGYNRDINVSFSGQVDGYRSKRIPFIQHLMENNISIDCSLFNSKNPPPHSKYVEILQRSKIVLNFSYSVDFDQLKGRVFEALLCGAMLMENENAQIQCYFTPGEDYVSFNSKEDLVDKIQYYLEHEDERLEIAARGELKVRNFYNHTEFWKKVINKLKEVQELPL